MEKIDLIKNNYLRDAVGSAAMELGKNHENVVFVSANVMSSCRVLDSLKEFPSRSFNVGIAEQEMISFASGMANEGFVAYAFTMAPFMSMRACEQVRTDVAYNNLNVRMIAPYAGVSGGISGATHWGLEDCAIMNGIAGMTILEPSDPIQAKKMVNATLDYKGPVYIRVGIDSVPNIYKETYEYVIGKASVPIDGDDGAFIVSGVLVKNAIAASYRIYEETGLRIRVVDMHTIKPIDKEAIIQASLTGRVVVAQDHNIAGGLGQIVAAIWAESGCVGHFKIVGIPDRFVVMAHAPYLYKKYGLDDNGLYKEMMNLLEKNE